MKKAYRTAQGKTVNVGAIMAQNEEVIAVGNMKTNARGDELGRGGQILRTRNQIMQDYYDLNTPVPTSMTAAEKEAIANGKAATSDIIESTEVGMSPEDAALEPDLTDEEIAAMKTPKKKGSNK